MAYRFGQGPRIQRRLCLHPFGHAMQELGEDRAGIAARAVYGVVADPRQQFADMAAAPAERAVEHAAQGRGHVVAGVAVGHREHIDAVQPVTGGNDPAGTGNQGTTQGRGSEGFVGSDRHVPESA